jgi:hypothetical protein
MYLAASRGQERELPTFRSAWQPLRTDHIGSNIPKKLYTNVMQPQFSAFHACQDTNVRICMSAVGVLADYTLVTFLKSDSWKESVA